MKTYSSIKYTLIILLLAILLLSTGCKSAPEHTVEPFVPTKNYVYRVMLYFLNTNGIDFSPEARDVFVPRFSTPEYEAINNLIQGPNSTLLEVCPEGTRLKYVYIIENTAFIDVTYNNNVEDVSFINFKKACEKTLAALSSVEYTVLTVNGVIPKEFEKEIDPSNRAVILYYTDDRSRYCIAQPYVLGDIPNEDVIERIILLLNLNPGIQGLKAAIPDNTSLYDYTIEYEGQTGGTVSIRLIGTVQLEEKDKMAMPCLALSILHSIPGINRVNLEYSTTQSSYNYSYTLRSHEYIRGTLLQLFFSDPEGVALVSTRRALNVLNATDITAYVRELFLGPGDDTNAKRIILANARNQLLNAYTEGKTVVLDFKKSFYESFKDLDEMQERLVVYSIVNTLTAKEEINSVLFLCEGENIETIAGYINLYQPLYSNPGLLKK